MRPALIFAAFCLTLYLGQPAYAGCVKGGATQGNTSLMYVSGAILAISLPLYYWTFFTQNLLHRKRAKFVASAALVFLSLTLFFWHLDKELKQSNAQQGCGTEYPLPDAELK